VEPVDADAMYQSLKAGRRVKLDHVGLFADGVAVRQVGIEPFRICRELVDEVIRVDTAATCAAIKDVFEDTRAVLEPAGALAIAGAKAWVERKGVRGKTLVAVACGANMNFDRLRFVAEEAELGEKREAVLAVTIPETPGSFRKFCSLLGPRNVTEFNYRFGDARVAHVFVGVQVHNTKPRGSCANCGAMVCRRSTSATTILPSRTCVTWLAVTPPGSSTKSFTASNSPSGRVHW
jgi:threonine dehydratase